MSLKRYACVVFFFVAFLLQRDVYAAVYKCPGAGGSVTLSNVEKGSGCTQMVLPPSSAPKKPTQNVRKDEAAKEPKAAEKPKTTYDIAAQERKRIIQEEIDLEKTRMNGVQARIKELSAVSNKSPDQIKELVALQQKESMHASNIQLLQKEISR